MSPAVARVKCDKVRGGRSRLHLCPDKGSRAAQASFGMAECECQGVKTRCSPVERRGEPLLAGRSSRSSLMRHPARLNFEFSELYVSIGLTWFFQKIETHRISSFGLAFHRADAWCLHSSVVVGPLPSSALIRPSHLNKDRSDMHLPIAEQRLSSQLTCSYQQVKMSERRRLTRPV